MTDDVESKIYCVTSAIKGAGKTTVAHGIAMEIARRANGKTGTIVYDLADGTMALSIGSNVTDDEVAFDEGAGTWCWRPSRAMIDGRNMDPAIIERLETDSKTFDAIVLDTGCPYGDLLEVYRRSDKILYVTPHSVAGWFALQDWAKWAHSKDPSLFAKTLVVSNEQASGDFVDRSKSTEDLQGLTDHYDLGFIGDLPAIDEPNMARFANARTVWKCMEIPEYKNVMEKTVGALQA